MSTSIHWREVDSGDSSTLSQRSESDGSYHSHSASPTVYDERPPLPQYEACYGRGEGRGNWYFDEPLEYEHDNPRASQETYASSEDELEEEDEYPEYEVPAYQEIFPTDALPATPRDFTELFPSSHKLSIRHDDATLDGNMNLRVDTMVETRHGHKQILTLFHLRMHDLKTRDFSLRRYCRESGREVCHTNRKYQKPPSERRPAIQRSFSSVLATLRNKNDRVMPSASLKRQDSGYSSMYGDNEDDARPESLAGEASKRAQLLPTNTIKLEFSNYAHVDVKRRGAKSSKRYDFEYWGSHYSWKRVTKRDGDRMATFYHLIRDDEGTPVAHIAPVRMSPTQAHEEAAKGGWVPPCSLWITDERIIRGMTDVADVLVASGLIALVDDSIKQHFHSKRTTQLFIPLPKTPSFKMEYIGPKRLIDEMFHRNTRGGSSSRQPTSRPASRRVSVEA